jgi:plasmid stability protein
MATLTIRNVDDKLVKRLKAQAKANQRSLEAELRMIVQRAVEIEKSLLLGEMRRIRDMTPKGRRQTDSVKIIHEMRRERDERLHRRR